jgi:hypothetical protein
MELARNIMFATASALLVTLAGCATTPRNPLVDSADTLAYNAHALADHSDAISPTLEWDAHQLAESTYQFRTAVPVNGTDDASAKTAFEAVSRNYQKVNDDVNQLNTSNARAALRPVTEAYQAVERRLGG